MARQAGTPATLNELMGKGGATISLSNLKEFLGERMPKIEYSKVGRMRLINALQERFGVNYRQIESVQKLLSDFDKELELTTHLKDIKGE